MLEVDLNSLTALRAGQKYGQMGRRRLAEAQIAVLLGEPKRGMLDTLSAGRSAARRGASRSLEFTSRGGVLERVLRGGVASSALAGCGASRFSRSLNRGGGLEQILRGGVARSAVVAVCREKHWHLSGPDPLGQPSLASRIPPDRYFSRSSSRLPLCCSTGRRRWTRSYR